MKVSLCLLILLTLIACSNGVEKLKIALLPVEISRGSIADLDDITRLVFRNRYLLAESAHNHYGYYPPKNSPERYRVFYYINPWMLEEYLPQNELKKAECLYRHSFEDKEMALDFIIDSINFRPADSAVIFRIKSASAGDRVVFHEITNSEEIVELTNRESLSGSVKCHRVQKLNVRWTYVILSYIDPERSL